MRLLAQVDNRDELVELGSFRASVADRAGMLRACGNLMRDSIARTFREEGSPAGSWPKLAASTLRNRKYTTGHKLLVMSGRLFGSITYEISGGLLTIGTSLVYAAVHQLGSRDWMGGAAGPRTREQMTDVAEHQGHATVYPRYKMVEVTDRHGNKRSVPKPMKYAKGDKRTVEFQVGAHTRRQNIPARPFLVFRPEDPDRLAEGVQAFLDGKAMRLGTVGGA